MGLNIKDLVENLKISFTTTNNIERKAAENYILSLEKEKNYALCLLNIVTLKDIPPAVCVAAAARFKNFLKSYWHEISDENARILPDERNLIKSNIVELMLFSSKPDVQRFLSESVVIICHYDDLERDWPNLLSFLSEKLSSPDLGIVSGVLLTASSLFKKYSTEFRSDELWRQIAYALKIFAESFTKSANNLVTKLLTLHEPKEILMVLGLCEEILKIFYYLNFQDLPEYFEDNMPLWMHIHQTLLDYHNSSVVSQDVPGPLEGVKSQACENISLYASKYDDADSPFGKYIPLFAEKIWGLLTSVGPDASYDSLVCSALSLLSLIVSRPRYAPSFDNPEVLMTLCEKVVIPNMRLRESDIVAFDIDCEEYIKCDIEGSDIGTRRRATCDLVQTLRVRFPERVTELFYKYVMHMLDIYRQHPKDWLAKDTAIHLVISLAVVGFVERFGTTKTNMFIDITSFYTTHILPELQNDNQTNALLLADCVKFIITFRNQIPKQFLLDILPLLQRRLLSPSYVLNSYCSICIERILFPRLVSSTDGRGFENVTKGDIRTLTPGLLTSLFSLLDTDESKENQYAMKAVMRVISVSQSEAASFVESLLDKICNKLYSVAKNPGRPEFNHYLFETLSAAIKYTCESNPLVVAAFEEKLWPTFTWILEQDVEEFIPYILQLIGQLLDLNQSIPHRYLDMFPIFLRPVVWERIGNVPALTRILQSFLLKSGPIICGDENTLLLVLGSFQKLISSKANDHLGFEILNTLLYSVPRNLYEQQVCPIFHTIFKRLSLAKTTKFCGCVLVFISILISKLSPDEVIVMINGIQSGLFSMVLDSLFLKELKFIKAKRARKACAVGITHLLTKSLVLISDYANKWDPLFSELLSLLECQAEDIQEDLADASVGHYQVSFVKLM
ncbi:exportin-2-like, partial [Zophobas morio]|uniref:exportin-2-like n=1 Tax=Zophobas morio TaxID=2755281 RepID=UPI0030831F35